MWKHHCFLDACKASFVLYIYLFSTKVIAFSYHFSYLILGKQRIGFIQICNNAILRGFRSWRNERMLCNSHFAIKMAPSFCCRNELFKWKDIVNIAREWCGWTLRNLIKSYLCHFKKPCGSKEDHGWLIPQCLQLSFCNIHSMHPLQCPFVLIIIHFHNHRSIP